MVNFQGSTFQQYLWWRMQSMMNFWLYPFVIVPIFDKYIFVLVTNIFIPTRNISMWATNMSPSLWISQHRFPATEPQISWPTEVPRCFRFFPERHCSTSRFPHASIFHPPFPLGSTSQKLFHAICRLFSCAKCLIWNIFLQLQEALIQI